MFVRLLAFKEHSNLFDSLYVNVPAAVMKASSEPEGATFNSLSFITTSELARWQG